MNRTEFILTVRIRNYHQPPFLVSKFCRKYISDMCYAIENCPNSIPLCPDIIQCKQNCKVCWEKAIDEVKEGGNPAL
jgi:hypothetical protein